jgi:hypothetical protein
MSYSRRGKRGIPKGGVNYFALGDINAVCDQCGITYKSSELTKQWDNLMACWKCWDPRHPQELIRPVVDPKPPPWTRPWVPQFTDPDVYATSRSINGFPFNFQSLD